MKGGSVMKRKLFQVGIMPWLYTGFMLAIFLPSFMENGKIDYFLLWVILGIPYGMGKTILVLLPNSYGIGESIGIFVLGCLFSGLIGGMILLYKLGFATLLLTICAISAIMKICRRKNVKLNK